MVIGAQVKRTDLLDRLGEQQIAAAEAVLTRRGKLRKGFGILNCSVMGEQSAVGQSQPGRRHAGVGLKRIHHLGGRLVILESHGRSAVVGDDGPQGRSAALKIRAKIQDLEDKKRNNGNAQDRAADEQRYRQHLALQRQVSVCLHDFR